MKLSLDGIRDKQQWKGVGLKLPEYDVSTVKVKTAAKPECVAFFRNRIANHFKRWLFCNIAKPYVII